MNRSLFFGSALLFAATLFGCGEESDVSYDGHSDELEDKVSATPKKQDYPYNSLSSWENIPPARILDPTPGPTLIGTSSAPEVPEEEDLDPDE